MPSYRKLPSGKWQATVYMPNGRRITETDKLLSVVKDWAIKQEAKFKSGDKRDPRAGRITVQEWHDRWWDARVVADTTAERDRKNLDRYVLPHWAGWPLESITRMEVEGWVRQLGKNGGRTRDGRAKPLGAPTVHLAYMVLSSMLKAAALEEPPIILHNPCSNVRLPPLPPKKRRYFTEDEIARILDKLVEPYRTMAELSMWSGLRFEELAGLHGRDVDWLRSTIPGIAQVSTPQGFRPHPKSERSDRVIPVPAHVLEAMSALMRGRGLHEPVFLNAWGRPVHYKTWHWHWTQALKAAKVPYAKPHTCRDTAASSLLHDGVSMFEVQQILGHESIKTTEKYSHHDPNAHVKIRAAWDGRSSRTSNARAAESDSN